MYIQVEELSGNVAPEVIPGTKRSKPNWIDGETGNYLTDEQLITRESLYPVIQNPPSYDSFYQKVVKNDETEWIVKSYGVEATYKVENLPLENIKNRLFRQLINLREKYETNGIDFEDSNGNKIEVDTTAESQIKITGSFMTAKEGYRKSKSNWKSKNGYFHKLYNTDVQNLSYNVFDFIQQCYDRESEIQDLIEAVDITGDYMTAIDEFKNIVNNEFPIGWPTNALYGRK